MPLTVILTIAAICCFAAAVNGILGAGFLLFTWAVLEGIIRQSQTTPPTITDYTWTPHLLLPVVLFLLIWQVRLRGRIGPQVGPIEAARRLFGQRRSSFG